MSIKCRHNGTKKGTNEMRHKPTDFANARQIEKILDVDANTLERLRTEHGLPFVKIDKSNKIYHLPSVFQWLFEKNTVLGLKPKNDTG